MPQDLLANDKYIPANYCNKTRQEQLKSLEKYFNEKYLSGRGCMSFSQYNLNYSNKNGGVTIFESGASKFGILAFLILIRAETLGLLSLFRVMLLAKKSISFSTLNFLLYISLVMGNLCILIIKLSEKCN